MIEKVEGLRPELQSQCLGDGELLEQRRVEVDQARPPQRSARHVAESTRGGHQEGPRIEPLVRSSQNHRSLEVRIPIRYVRLAGVARPGWIGAHQRRERESTLPIEDPIPLPASDQMVLQPAGATRESLPAPERQLITVAGVELVREAEGCNPFVQPANIGTDNSGRLIFAGRGQNGRIVIQHFAETVVRFKSESSGGSLDQ